MKTLMSAGVFISPMQFRNNTPVKHHGHGQLWVPCSSNNAPSACPSPNPAEGMSKCLASASFCQCSLSIWTDTSQPEQPAQWAPEIGNSFYIRKGRELPGTSHVPLGSSSLSFSPLITSAYWFFNIVRHPLWCVWYYSKFPNTTAIFGTKQPGCYYIMALVFHGVN